VPKARLTGRAGELKYLKCLKLGIQNSGVRIQKGRVDETFNYRGFKMSPPTGLGIVYIDFSTIMPPLARL